jgi:hypothetical protein
MANKKHVLVRIVTYSRYVLYVCETTCTLRPYLRSPACSMYVGNQTVDEGARAYRIRAYTARCSV